VLDLHTLAESYASSICEESAQDILYLDDFGEIGMHDKGQRRMAHSNFGKIECRRKPGIN
jgi:uncharacterized protein (UPF0262 family)